MPLLNGIARIDLSAILPPHFKAGARPLLILCRSGGCARLRHAGQGEGLPKDGACFVAHGVMTQERIGSFIALKSKKRMGCQLIDRGMARPHPKVKGRQHGHSGLQRHASDCIELLGIGTIYRSTPERFDRSRVRTAAVRLGEPLPGWEAQNFR
jgi:hypothetical protein